MNEKRYREKIAIIGSDPYLLPPSLFCPLLSSPRLPNFNFHDLYVYLVHNPSPYTGESLKAYKSTDAYQYAVAGWVKDVGIWYLETKDFYLIIGHVHHSQALNAKPTWPWIVVQENGTVVMAHCTCMAGLGEVCSHAAALMYTLLAAVEHREGQACTSEPCSWAEPSQSYIKYDELANIFVKKKAENPQFKSSQVQHMTPSSDELQDFFEQLYQSETQEAIPKKSAILSVIEGHSFRYTPKTAQLDMPPLLTSLYISTRLELDLPALLEEGAKIFEELHLTPEQCMLVEEKTREQRKSRVWFDHRAGRVTASVFHEAARTNNSSSLIKRVCYPRSSHFSTEATRWGLQNEDTARESYWKAMQDVHEDFHITASGLMINPDLPWIAASPDGVVRCNCHGMGVLEIKCPFTANGRTLKECSRDPRFCLTDTAEGTMTLRQDHSYMHQVQTQMRVAEVMYADFVVWTPQELFTQRILFDETFFDQAYVNVEEFIRTGILPELLGKWFTVPRLSSLATDDLAPEGCYCGKPIDNADVLACMSKTCKRKHFHRSCLKLSRLPKSWMCVECKKLTKMK